jgi:hypothetical protein
MHLKNNYVSVIYVIRHKIWEKNEIFSKQNQFIIRSKFANF